MSTILDINKAAYVRNPQRIKYDSIDTAYDSAKDEGMLPVPLSYERKREVWTQDILRIYLHKPSEKGYGTIKRQIKHKKEQFDHACLKLSNLEKPIVKIKKLSIKQLKAMLQGQGLSFPLESRYIRILNQLEARNLITRNKHNQYVYNPIQGCEPVFYSVGDTVRVRAMQEIYTVTKIINMNGTNWYALVNSVGRGLSACKAGNLTALKAVS